jgi:hypothetical protein
VAQRRILRNFALYIINKQRKIMKKRLLTLTWMALALTCAKANVVINSTNFPDENFRAQVAEALGLTFYYCGAISDEFKLKGYGNAAGEYVPTEFYKAFTQGGLLMLDELDASDPQVLVAINAAISQRYVDFPVIGRVDAHPDFRVVSAGNTFGTGASMAYTGRSSLDASTLNRFGYLKVDYDQRIDLCCAGNDKELCEFGHSLRKAAELTGLSLLVSYRQFTMMSQLLAGGMFTTEHAIEFAITKGMQRDELVILDNAVDINDNKYAQALHRLAHA